MRTAGSDLAWPSHISSPSAGLSEPLSSASQHKLDCFLLYLIKVRTELGPDIGRITITEAVTIPQLLIFLQAVSE